MLIKLNYPPHGKCSVTPHQQTFTEWFFLTAKIE